MRRAVPSCILTSRHNMGEPRRSKAHPPGSLFFLVTSEAPDTLGNDIYGSRFLLRNVGPANGWVSLPQPVGEPSNACLAKFDLKVGDKAANKQDPINVWVSLCHRHRATRPFLACGLVCGRVGERRQSGQDLG